MMWLDSEWSAMCSKITRKPTSRPEGHRSISDILYMSIQVNKWLNKDMNEQGDHDEAREIPAV